MIKNEIPDNIRNSFFNILIYSRIILVYSILLVILLLPNIKNNNIYNIYIFVYIVVENIYFI